LSSPFRIEVLMRQSSRRSRRLTAALAVGIVAGFGFTTSAIGSVATAPVPTPLPATVRAVRVARITPATVTPTTATPVARVVAKPVARAFATGNARLDALLATLPAVLFEGKATVHFGYNPIDCCHAGGYNPGPNDVWVSKRALTSDARLVYVTAHELGHSLHLHSSRGAALTAAVAGAPVVRAGSPWDVSEKVADCVAWVLFPAQTAASGLTYWTCPDPWRAQVRAALA
jgi:Zn-dependent protease with chaperone function